MKTIRSLVLFFIFACTQLQGQYRFNSLGTGDGLPHDKIISIRQDESGFIWIGTRDGIARYDGRDLKVIRPEQPKETSRVDNHIVSIFPSKNGDTWFSTFQPGIYRYNLKEDKIEYYPMNAEGKVRARDRIIIHIIQWI
jgi:ligand-binding sensor domain-containing protein